MQERSYQHLSNDPHRRLETPQDCGVVELAELRSKLLFNGKAFRQFKLDLPVSAVIHKEWEDFFPELLTT